MAIKFKQKNPIQIFKFGKVTDGNASMKNELGGKGANLAEMSSIGIPVPSGFTIPCAISVKYSNLLGKGEMQVLAGLSAEIDDRVTEGLNWLNSVYGYMPLVSVRSGARVSMPGMMDTILNVGLTQETLPWWTEKIGEHPALDSYRRLIQMYSSVALGVPMKLFDDALSVLKRKEKVEEDKDLTCDALRELIETYLGVVADAGKDFPDTMEAQVSGAVRAVFASWNNPRAIEYRKIHNIPEDWGTAVTIQSMVFGNMNAQSATGVLFTRDPSTGDGYVTGEFLVNAQGEDVVAGIRTPQHLEEMALWNGEVADELLDVAEKLEEHYKDMQDIEFTVQSGELFLLQTRSGKRSAKAAFKIAHDLVEEGLITTEEALQRVTSKQFMLAMQDVIDPTYTLDPILQGIPAGGGVVSGVAMFSAESAINCKEKCILVTKETDPDDIGGMNASVGILTATGGLTSHAAVVARGMDKVCVVGATSLTFHPKEKIAGVKSEAGSFTFTEGDEITIDGATGRVWLGKVPILSGERTPEMAKMLEYALLGSYEIIDLQSTAKASREVIKEIRSPKVLVRTGVLDMVLSGKRWEVGAIIKQSLQALAQNEYIQHLILELDPPASLGDADHGYFYMTASDTQGMLDEKVLALETVEGVDSLKQKTTIKITTQHGLSLEDLKATGWQMDATANTIADVFASNGTVSFSEEAVKRVFGTEKAMEEFFTIMEEKLGRSLRSVAGVSKYWFEAFGSEA